MTNGASSPVWSPDSTQIVYLAGMNAQGRAKEDSLEEDNPPQDKLSGKQRKERKEWEETRRWDPRVIEHIPYISGTNFLKDHRMQIYVIPITENTTNRKIIPRRLTDVDADHNAPQWSPDGQYIVTARIDDPARDEPGRWSSIFRIRVADSTHEQLTDDSYSSFGPIVSPDGQWIAFGRYPREQLSERITRLAIMSINGGNIRDLNLKLDRNVTEFKWKYDSSGLVFAATSEGSIKLHGISLDADQPELLIDEPVHIESFDTHPRGGIAFTVSSPENPNELCWTTMSEKQVKYLTALNRKYLDKVFVQTTYDIHWQTTDGSEIQGWYVLPIGYEEGQQYPLILNIHGGPHIMWGPGTKSMWHEWQFHAARGYVVFYCNPRGADGYGEAFQMALHGKWGEVAMSDIMSGVDSLIEKGFVDRTRLSITGGSYGGYMTTWITAHSDRFIAAVAQRGVYNLGFVGTTDIASFIPTEFGVEPWENPDFLWQQSPLAHAHKIKTPMLLIHGDNDFRVPISEAEQMFTYIRRTGGTVKLIRFPREGHEMTRSGEPEHRVANLKHMIEWFDKYCFPNTFSGLEA
ncbi:MAG: S9 family peptidase [Anaerolineae bacterium]